MTSVLPNSAVWSLSVNYSVKSLAVESAVNAIEADMTVGARGISTIEPLYVGQKWSVSEYKYISKCIIEFYKKRGTSTPTPLPRGFIKKMR